MMATRLDVGLTSGSAATAAERKLALSKMQIIIDSAVSPRIDLRPTDEGSFIRVVFPDDVAVEQHQACFNAAVNQAGLPESPLALGSPILEDVTSGDSRSGSRQRVYSV